MVRINFAHAFERWHRLAEREHSFLKGEEEKASPVASWEALDHVCGLAAESGMKALLFHGKFEKPDASGDYPAGLDGRRPHIDGLFDTFLFKVQGRKGNEWVRRLGGVKGAPPIRVFNAWRTEHRYAVDGTVSKPTVLGRLEFLKKLKSLIDEEGAA